MRVTLRDGSRLEIRPIRPEDRAELAAGFERLSPESRYRRFFGAVTSLSERELDYLTQVDHRDHEALVAVDPETGDGVGVARYVRTAPGVAEPAVVVIDEWQRRGVASKLLDALAQRAREEHVARFQALVLATNNDAIHALERLGNVTMSRAGPEVEMTIELPPADGAGIQWHRLLAQVASGVLEPARTLRDFLWPRRLGSPHDQRRNIIVVGTDGSEHALSAVQKAGQLALASQATVEVVGAQRLLPPHHVQIEDAVAQAVRGLRDRGIQVEEHVRRGEPALVLTDIAAEHQARLIVVGAGQHRPTTRRFIGSVADLVAERSPCDVLIVRDREHAAHRAGAAESERARPERSP